MVWWRSTLSVDDSMSSSADHFLSPGLGVGGGGARRSASDFWGPLSGFQGRIVQAASGSLGASCQVGGARSVVT